MRKIKDMFFRGRDIRGEIGIEVEMEGANFPLFDLNKWDSKHDGSLRGEKEDSTREFVLQAPCPRAQADDLLDELENELKEYGSTINPSYRTGVHIHTNVRHMTFNQLFTYLFCYYVVEDALMSFCGEERIGNLFCLRATDAEGLLKHLAECIDKNSLNSLKTDKIRYSSMNLKSIIMYGSVEFRGLPFNGDFNSIKTWIKLLLRIKDYSLTLNNPLELAQLTSEKGGQELAKDIFGEMLDTLPDIDWDYSMIQGVRLVQRLIYSSDWKEEDDVVIIKTKLHEEVDEPFNRECLIDKNITMLSDIVPVRTILLDELDELEELDY